MNAGTKTGYEKEFDFAPRDADKTYLLATVPRTGSTWLSHLLWSTGCLGSPLEYLNFEPAGPYGFAANAPSRQFDTWKHVVRHRVTPNGVFGIKGFPEQFQSLERENLELLRHVLRVVLPGRRSANIVQLRRRDKEAHAISYARAILSGVWRHEQEGRGENALKYEPRAVENAAALLERQERTWELMFAELRVSPLVLWYEDAIADPRGVCGVVAEHLGVELKSDATISVPEIRRQDQAGAIEWIERYKA